MCVCSEFKESWKRRELLYLEGQVFCRIFQNRRTLNFTLWEAGSEGIRGSARIRPLSHEPHSLSFPLPPAGFQRLTATAACPSQPPPQEQLSLQPLGDMTRKGWEGKAALLPWETTNMEARNTAFLRLGKGWELMS